MHIRCGLFYGMVMLKLQLKEDFFFNPKENPICIRMKQLAFTSLKWFCIHFSWFQLDYMKQLDQTPGTNWNQFKFPIQLEPLHF